MIADRQLPKPPDIHVGDWFVSRDPAQAATKIQVNRVWYAEATEGSRFKDDHWAVAYDIHGQRSPGSNRPYVSHSAINETLFRRMFKPEKESPAAAYRLAAEELEAMAKRLHEKADALERKRS